MSEQAINFDLDGDGVLTATIDMPGRAMNVINESLDAGFSELEAKLGDDAVKGVILTSGKDSFVAGADIDGFLAMTDPQVVFESSEMLKKFLRTLETSGKPVVCAMPGTALGGGLEIAMSCHHRIALKNPKAKFGLPEVKLGLLPGGGGTQRLPRIVGMMNALPLMMEGKDLRVDKAHEMGIINELADDAADMMAKARSFIRANPEAQQPWDVKGFRYPGGDAKNPKVVQMLAIAPSMLRQKTQGNYPAPENIMQSVVEGSLVDFDTACRIESRYFAELAVGDVSKAMIGTLWHGLNKIKKGASRPDGVERYKTKKVGILGAGMMGAGIAYVSAKVGIDVVLKDVTMEGAERGKAYSEAILEKAVKRGRMAPADKSAILDRIQCTDATDPLADCDLIIEAVFEDRGLKAKVTAETEAVIADTAVFASNTSTLPITGLAEASKRAENFIGLHFFSPVDKMPLVEIITGEKTSDETLARGFDYVLQIRKTPIVVKDSRGFYTSRVFGTYVMEGISMLLDGYDPQAIESAGMKAGMPVGPLALQDEVSLSLGLHVWEQTKKDMAAEGKEPPMHPGMVVVEKFVNDLNRPGKKAGAGFYEYPEGGKKKLWGELDNLYPNKDGLPGQEAMIERMLFAQANETARCWEEGLLRNSADANVGAIFGWGFAPHLGGPLQYINSYGVERFVERSREFAKAHGERFEPAEVLVKMAASGDKFEPY